MDEVNQKLQSLLRQVFGDMQLVITPGMTAADIEGWDSLTHVNLMMAIEKRFGIRFSVTEMNEIRGDEKTVADLAAMVQHKLESKGK